MHNAITTRPVRLPDHLDLDRPTTYCGKVLFGMYRVEPTLMTSAGIVTILTIIGLCAMTVLLVGTLHTNRSTPDENKIVLASGGTVLSSAIAVTGTFAGIFCCCAYKKYRQDVREHTFTA